MITQNSKSSQMGKRTCKIGWDKNPEELQFSPEKKEEQFEFVVKMAVIIKELMNGCDNLDRHSPKKQSDTTLWQLVSRDRDSGQTSIQTVTSQKLC